MGGGSGMFGNSGIISAMRGQQSQGQSQGSPSFQSPASLAQQATGRPETTSYQPTPGVSPIVQQMANKIAAQQTSPFNTGLQGLYNRFALPQQPMMRAPMPMPQYGTQGNPLAYRPNIQAVQQNLSRVKPSVYKTDLDSARARIAELEAAEQARQQASYDYGWGGGG